MTEDPEFGDKYVVTNEVATSEAATSKVITSKAVTHNKAKIQVDIKKIFDKKPSNIIGWSLAVSDIVDDKNNIGLVAISCITDKDMNPKGGEGMDPKGDDGMNQKNMNQRKYQIYFTLLRPFIITDIKQFQLSHASGGGMIKLFKFSYTKNSQKKSATLICMDYMRIQKIKIKLKSIQKRMQFGCRKNISVSKDGTYLLPENLFEKLESIKDAKRNWKFLLKSRYQEFLMIDTSNHQKINIEIYDVNNLQLVNVFYRHRGEQCLNSNDKEPGIFAISTDSRLFAYSYYGNNVITLYLMENGLEIVSKRFDKIYKIKFLEFIEKDKKLFIIGEDKEHNVKFHIWIISGCFKNDFPVSRDDIKLSGNDISTLLKYDEYYHTLTKANGKIVTLEKYNEDRFKVLLDILPIKRTAFRENDVVADEHNEHKYRSSDLEPWNNNVNDTRTIHGRFLNNDRRFLFIIGQNSIQVWKSKSPYFIDFNDFHNFEDSNLVYILISDNIRPEAETKFLVEDDMTTVITHACKSLAYLYRSTKSIDSKKNQKFVSGIINIIKDFIKRYPDNWKLMEVQHPLMAYLIYSHRDAVMLAYLLEYYSENFMSHIGWMLNVTKILPDLSKLSNHDYYGNYMDSLLFKPCFGEMKYNFPIKRFQKLSVCENTLKVYVPVTALISTNLSNILRYKKSLEETSFSPFLRIKKSEKAFFSIPAMEAVINSRWPQAMTYLMLPLGLYVAFLILFDTISWFYLSDDLPLFASILVMFYYIGTYLLAIEIRQIIKYRTKYITIFNVFDIGSIIFAIIVASMILANNIIENYSINIVTINTDVIVGMFFFAYPSLLTKEDLTSTEASQDKPLDTIWDAVLSMYYLNTNNLDDYSNYWPFKLLVFTANIVIVLVLLNMIIALMNDTFNKAKEDSNLGLMMYRTELIDDFERLEIPFINFKLYNSPYICYLQDPDLMKKWMEKSQKLRESKLYSWFDESVDNDNVSKENRTYYDKVNFTPWYELISGSKNQVPFTTLEDHETLWF
ncbi:20628_t:CDS:2 [Rhizophagus irregularis]|nr:20628_t:CDS:2 [Rhizophagus irregularis]